MERVKEAIHNYSDIAEAWLINDRTVELLMTDGRGYRITAAESLKSGGYTAIHRKRVDLSSEPDAPEAWAPADLPWATGDTIEDCLLSAVLLMRVP